MVDEVAPESDGRIEELEQECQRLRDALVASETRLSVLFNHFLDSILIVDATSGKILMANRAAVNFFQYSRLELVGHHFSLLFPKECEADRRALLDKLRLHGHVFVEQQFMRKDGGTVCANLSAVMVKWDADVAVLLSVADSVECRAAESLKLETHRTQTRLDAITRLYHEISNPLQELLTSVQLGGDDTLKEPILRIADVLKRQREQQPEPPERQESPAVSLPEGAAELEPTDENSILIVDDEPNIRDLFKRALAKCFPAYEIDAAGNGAEALPMFKTKHHRIVIMDVEMPVMPGNQAFAEIARICREKHWRMPNVVFCTGFDLPPSVRSVVEASPRHTCLLKPVNVDDLRDELVTHMGA